MRFSHRSCRVQFDNYAIAFFLPASERVFRIKGQFKEQGRMRRTPTFPEAGKVVTMAGIPLISRRDI